MYCIHVDMYVLHACIYVCIACMYVLHEYMSNRVVSQNKPHWHPATVAKVDQFQSPIYQPRLVPNPRNMNISACTQHEHKRTYAT